MGMFSNNVEINEWRNEMSRFPWLPVERGPRGGLGGKYFVLEGSAKFQNAFNAAMRRAGYLGPPADPGARITDYAKLERRTGHDGRVRTAVLFAWETIGYVPAHERRRVDKVMDATGGHDVCVEIWLYRAQTNGWNARVIV